jgi:hypothetical protein
MAAKPKSPTADLKQAPAGTLSPKSQNFGTSRVAPPLDRAPRLTARCSGVLARRAEFESAPPGAAADLDSDEQEMLRVLKNPPAEARTDPAWRAYVEIGYITKAVGGRGKLERSEGGVVCELRGRGGGGALTLAHTPSPLISCAGLSLPRPLGVGCERLDRVHGLCSYGLARPLCNLLLCPALTCAALRCAVLRCVVCSG